jgi:preprotein translocase subunit SecF
MARDHRKERTAAKKEEMGKINFLSWSPIFAVVSTLVVLAAIAIIGIQDLNYGIDFAGGTEIQVKFPGDVGVSKVRDFLKGTKVGDAQVQTFGDSKELLIRFENAKGKTEQETNLLNMELIKNLTTGLKSSFAGVDIRRVDSVGPQVGAQLKRNGLLAVLYSLLLILIYVGLRFEYNFAPGAVVCLFHDSLITLGILTLLGKEINIQILAAILTIIGYSLNDTIVVFDRIRENIGVYKGRPLDRVINRSINDTLTRTLLTSLTTLIAVLALYFLAGGVIKDFAFAMAIGIVIGTYSSVYIASPLILVFDRMAVAMQKRKEARA